MASFFESEVYSRERHTPWARVDLIRFMKEMALSGKDEVATLSIIHRPSVATRLWWVLSWVSIDGQRHEVEAQTLDKCLWRAATLQLRLEKKREEKDIKRIADESQKAYKRG